MARLNWARPIGVVCAIAAVGIAGCGSTSSSSSGGSSSSTAASASSGSGSSGNCTPASKFKTLNGDTLTVATLDGLPYAGYTGSELTGADGQILIAFAKAECLKLSVKDLGAAAVIPTVQTGRADVAAGGWYRSAARAKIVDLSNPVYSDQTAIVSKQGYDTFGQLKGLSVGAVSGFVFDDDLQKLFGSNLKLYPSSDALDSDLKDGRIAAEVNSLGNASYALKGTDVKIEIAKPDPQVAASVQPGQVGFPIYKGDTGMVDAMNAFLAKIRADGTLAKILVANGFSASAAQPGAPRLIE